MMQARLLAIYANYGEYITRLSPLQIENTYLKAVIYFADGSNLRVAEEWDGERLIRYSYYWLATNNRLKIGWDNAPHHPGLPNFPHHKHEGQQAHRAPSDETCLEDVMRVIVSKLPPVL